MTTEAGSRITNERDFHTPACPRWFAVSEPDASCECLLPSFVAAAERIDEPRLARAILNVGISALDWHIGQIVKGEDDEAGKLAALIATNYNEAI